MENDFCYFAKVIEDVIGELDKLEWAEVKKGIHTYIGGGWR